MSSLKKKSTPAAVVGRRLRRFLGGMLAAGFGVAWWSFVPPAMAAATIAAPMLPAPVEPVREPIAVVTTPLSVAVVTGTRAVAFSALHPTRAKRTHHKHIHRPPTQVPVGDPPVVEPPTVEPPTVEPPVVEPVLEPVVEPVAEPVDDPENWPPITTRSS